VCYRIMAHNTVKVHELRQQYTSNPLKEYQKKWSEYSEQKSFTTEFQKWSALSQ
jgi:hypothetical protein